PSPPAERRLLITRAMSASEPRGNAASSAARLLPLPEMHTATRIDMAGKANAGVPFRIALADCTKREGARGRPAFTQPVAAKGVGRCRRDGLRLVRSLLPEEPTRCVLSANRQGIRHANTPRRLFRRHEGGLRCARARRVRGSPVSG